MIYFWLAYPKAFGVGFWSLVLTKSNGWNIMVENVPENDPTRKDFSMGYCEQKNIYI
jgi:hypothetical protein